MASTAILYNGLNLFSGNGAVGPTPFFTTAPENIYYGSRWGTVQNISLIGQITGKCSGDFEDLVNKQNRLISGFGEDFHSLQINQNGVNLYDKNYLVIRDINFDQSRYINLLNYSITATLYDPDLWSGFFGTLDPLETWNFSEGENGVVDITHEISCRGFNTNLGALQNAKDWVLARTGWNNQINPSFIQKCYSGGWNLCPQDFQESINRLTAEYRVTERFVSDIYNSGIGIVRYTTVLNSGVDDGLTSVTINGNIDYCRNGTLSGMRARYQSLDLYSIAVNAYKNSTNLINLNPYFLTSGVEENAQNLLMSFSTSFNNDPSPIVSLDYKVNLNTDELSDITTVGLTARIFSRGNLATRYARVLNFYDNDFSPYYLANTQYMAAGYTYLLNVQPQSETCNKNPLLGEINYGATWTNKKAIPSGLYDLNYSISVQPPVRQFSEKPSIFCNGTWFVYDLGYINRERVSINGQATVAKDNNIESGVAIVQNYVNQLKNSYAPGNWDSNRLIIDTNQLVTGDPADRFISFSVGWSRNSSEIIF